MFAMLKSEYMFNKDFRKYVDEYCNKNGCTKEEAFYRKEVKQTFWKHTNV